MQTQAERFLEALQHRVYSSLGLTAEDCQRREWAGTQVVLPARLQQMAQALTPPEFERYRAALLEGLSKDEEAQRPTRFERPHQYSILRELKEAVEQAAQRLRLHLPVQPVIGTLPTQLLEPLMLPVPGTRDVVLVVDGTLLTYANLLAKAVAQTLPLADVERATARLADNGEWQSRIDPSGAGRGRFVELMLATLQGNPGGAPAHLPEPDWEQTAIELCDCMELFLVAREYARLIEGDHLEATPETRSAHGQSFDALVWTGEQELKADWMGLALMLAAADEQGTPTTWAFWAADLLVASFGIYDRAAWFVRNGTAGTPSDPYPTIHDQRRALLRRLMRQWGHGPEAVEFADALQPVLDVLEADLTAVLSAPCSSPVH